ncbi:hypothetical protein [Effusibacillus lacus]|uniref:Uncharacterized protein n=1 Tax=Effusibacillus lacus TaxID=1348429 RepID=A0A292YQQ1_9BACL|nr:hypothetical protein [Effusibacillus lacus]TCS70079.1 hypothetical protein EDD64_13444 [Effusibacillus lacus]GAX91083.1 hypothetical protein EFBL_2743 [Effusibacillus lacus]
MGFYKLKEEPEDNSKRMKGSQELELVQAWQKDVLIEEFPEGPYGAQIFLDQKIGKSTGWEPGQQVVNRFKDENPTLNDFKVPTDQERPDL